MSTTYSKPTKRIRKEHIARLLVYLGVALFVAFCLAPFLWIVSTSLKAPSQLHTRPPELISWPPFFKNYIDIFRGRPFAQNIWNSVVVAGWATFLSLVVGSFAAYALARLQFKGRDLILSMVLAVSMFPGIAIVSPLYLSFSRQVEHVIVEERRRDDADGVDDRG